MICSLCINVKPYIRYPVDVFNSINNISQEFIEAILGKVHKSANNRSHT